MKFIETFDQYIEVCKAMGEEPLLEAFNLLQQDISDLKKLLKPKTLNEFINAQLLLGIQYKNTEEAQTAFSRH